MEMKLKILLLNSSLFYEKECLHWLAFSVALFRAILLLLKHVLVSDLELHHFSAQFYLIDCKDIPQILPYP